MDYKINIKKLMEENDLTLYKLNKICELSINTLRKLMNDPSDNTTLHSLSILAKVFDCRISDLIEDEPSIIYFETTAEKLKDNPLFIEQQIFSPTNVEYLKELLLQIGVSCNISSYSNYRTVSIKNDYELSSIQVDINMRVLSVKEFSYLHVINFYCQVNQVLLDESVIKNALIQALEKYARRLSFNGIKFTIQQDFERQTDPFSNSFSDVPANFTYTLGTPSNLFEHNNYERISCPEFEKHQIEYQKRLNE